MSSQSERISLPGPPLTPLVGLTGLFDGLQLLLLSGVVVGGGGEAQGLPDGLDLGRADVGLPDEGEVDSEAGKAGETSDLVGLLVGAVEAVAKAVLVETLLKTDLGDDLLSVPEVFEADARVLEQTKVLHLHGRTDAAAAGLGGHALLAELTDRRAVDRVGRCAAGGEKDGGG